MMRNTDRNQGRPRPRRHLLRDLESGRQLDLMLVSAVAAVLGIRFYLAVTGYPKVGGESLHIAHMLWGGLLMLTALVLLLIFVGRRPQKWAALLGGLGFGTFIDEVGKFVTHDNDYFYRPTVAIIYVVFVLLYLGIRAVQRRRTPSRAEYLVNAVQELEEVVVDDLDQAERDRALQYLDHYGADEFPAPALRSILADAPLVATPTPGPTTRLAGGAQSLYRRAVTTPWFGRALVTFFILQFAAGLLRVGSLAAPLPGPGQKLLSLPLVNPLPVAAGDPTATAWLLLGSNVLAGAFIAAGVLAVVRGRLPSALRRFQRSQLVSLVLTQVFVFYRVEWLGLVQFAFHLLVFVALQFMLEQRNDDGSPPPQGT